MLLTLVTGALASLLAVQQDVDTTVAVQRGQRLDVEAFGGSITVRSWNRNAVRVRAVTGSRVEVEVSTSGSTVDVEASNHRGGPPTIDFEISAPAWMPVEANGVNTDIVIEGIQAAISAETVQGEIRVIGGNGVISLQSVEGEVTLQNARGRIEASSVNEAVTLTNVSGEITAETVNGDIEMRGIQSEVVDVTTVNGEVVYDGSIRNNGRYRFNTHNGDVTVSIPEGAGATVFVSTFNGDFESAFPVTLSGGRHGKRFNFTIGNGSARVELESFQGTIQLRRPGAVGR